MDVSKNRATQNGWFIYNGKPYEQIHDLGGGPNPLFSETPHISLMSGDISKRSLVGFIKVLPPATAASAFPGSAYPGKKKRRSVYPMGI